MSRNAIAAMAVIFVSGFAGCAATARATEAQPAKAITEVTQTMHVAPLRETHRDVSAPVDVSSTHRAFRTP